MEEVRESDVSAAIHLYKRQGYTVIALEQSAQSISLPNYVFPDKVMLLLGKVTTLLCTHSLSLSHSLTLL